MTLKGYFNNAPTTPHCRQSELTEALIKAGVEEHRVSLVAQKTPAPQPVTRQPK